MWYQKSKPTVQTIKRIFWRLHCAPEVLVLLNALGMPLAVFKLKKRALVMVLWNIDPPPYGAREYIWAIRLVDPRQLSLRIYT